MILRGIRFSKQILMVEWDLSENYLYLKSLRRGYLIVGPLDQGVLSWCRCTRICHPTARGHCLSSPELTQWVGEGEGLQGRVRLEEMRGVTWATNACTQIAELIVSRVLAITESWGSGSAPFLVSSSDPDSGSGRTFPQDFTCPWICKIKSIGQYIHAHTHSHTQAEAQSQLRCRKKTFYNRFSCTFHLPPASSSY